MNLSDLMAGLFMCVAAVFVIVQRSKDRAEMDEMRALWEKAREEYKKKLQAQVDEGMRWMSEGDELMVVLQQAVDFSIDGVEIERAYDYIRLTIVEPDGKMYDYSGDNLRECLVALRDDLKKREAAAEARFGPAD